MLLLFHMNVFSVGGNMDVQVSKNKHPIQSNRSYFWNLIVSSSLGCENTSYFGSFVNIWVCLPRSLRQNDFTASAVSGGLAWPYVFSRPMSYVHLLYQREKFCPIL